MTDLPRPGGRAPLPARIAVSEPSHVHIARSHAVGLAHAAGMRSPRLDAVALVATELAENLHRYAHGGEIVVLVSGRTDHDAGRLDVLALDRGPGVEQFTRCLVDGYSTGGTLGGGLGAVRRKSDFFDAVSEPGVGTVVCAGFGTGDRTPAQPSRGHVDVGALGFPLEQGEPNGDSLSVVRRGSRVVVMLADGLGHGALAAQASTAAVDMLPALADRRPNEVLAEVGRRLVSSRGAAVTVASVELDALRHGGEVHSSGLGNVGVMTVGPDGTSHRIATAHGTAGVRTGPLGGTRVPAEQVSRFPARGLLIMHTDGLTTRWTLDGRAELLRHTAVVIAAALWRDHARDSDDSMIVAVKAHP